MSFRKYPADIYAKVHDPVTFHRSVQRILLYESFLSFYFSFLFPHLSKNATEASVCVHIWESQHESALCFCTLSQKGDNAHNCTGIWEGD